MHRKNHWPCFQKAKQDKNMYESLSIKKNAIISKKKKEIVKLSKVLDVKKCLRNNDITSKNRRISKMYNTNHRSNTAR